MFSLHQWADRFEKLLARLPGAIRTPVEAEWRPLRELFLQRRPARLLILGPEAAAFFTPPPGAVEAESRLWQKFHHRGTLLFATATLHSPEAQAAVREHAPDAILYLAPAGAGEAEQRSLAELRALDHQLHGTLAPLFITTDESYPWEEAQGILPAEDRHALLEAVARILPAEARLEFARVTGEKAVQREIALSLTRSTTAVATAIGAQPIPLADLPILIALQTLMVGGILHAAGREWTMKTAREFLSAAGVNVGAAFLLREGARAAAKFLPGWGHAVSGAVAGMGTYAIGKAAIAFFIDGVPLDEVRQRLRRQRKKALPPAP